MSKILVALLLVGCGGAVEASSSEPCLTAAELRAGPACTQIGRRCAFDANDQPAAVEPESALKCECLGEPLTYQCGPQTWR